MSWPKACLGEVAQIVSGATPKSSVGEYWDGDIPWITPADLSKLTTKEVSETTRQITAAGLASCSSRILPPRSVLFSSRAPIGHVAINSVPMATNQGFKSFVPNEKILSPDFLYWWIKANKAYLQSLGRGATFKEVSKEIVEAIEIPLPPLEEQRRIAATLDKANQILIVSRKADELRQLLLERVFTSMFGDPRENPIGWPKLAIEELTSDYVGGAALVPEDFEDEGVPVLHKGAIKPGGRIEADSRKKGFVSHQTAQHYQQCLAGPDRIAVTLRDLVPSGPFIGLMADLSTTGVPEYLLAQGAYAFKVDARRLLPDYLIALVNMPTFRLVLRQNAVGSTQIHIRLPIFKSIEIPVPPIESQLEFAQVIDRISSLNTLSRRQVHRVDELTRSLHGSYF